MTSTLGSSGGSDDEDPTSPALREEEEEEEEEDTSNPGHGSALRRRSSSMVRQCFRPTLLIDPAPELPMFARPKWPSPCFRASALFRLDPFTLFIEPAQINRARQSQLDEQVDRAMLEEEIKSQMLREAFAASQGASDDPQSVGHHAPCTTISPTQSLVAPRATATPPPPLRDRTRAV